MQSRCTVSERRVREECGESGECGECCGWKVE